MSAMAERAAIVAWLRSSAEENASLAETQKHPLQRGPFAGLWEMRCEWR